MKKVVTYIFLVLNVLAFSDSFNENEDERTILKQEQRSEQERLQKEFQKREEDFNKLKLEKAEISATKASVNEIKFHISQINLEDKENLLNEIEKENILGKYIDKDLGSTDITNLVTELTNRLIVKGYITSVVTISENNDKTFLFKFFIIIFCLCSSYIICIYYIPIFRTIFCYFYFSCLICICIFSIIIRIIFCLLILTFYYWI